MIETQENLHFLDYWRVIRSRKEIVIAVFLLVVITGLIVTFSLPKIYMASVLIQVKDEEKPVDVFDQRYTGYNPLFLRTQFEIIQSAPVIEEVIRKRELDSKLARAYGFDMLPKEKAFDRAFKILSKSLKVQQYRDTDLIEIQIYLSEPKGQAPLEAAQTANVFAQVYRDQSLARSRRATEAALKALQQSLDERNKVVEDAARNVEEVRQKYKLSMLSLGARSDSSTEKLYLARLEDARIRMRTELEDKKARADMVARLPDADLLAAAPYVIGDPALAALVQARRETEVKRMNLLSESLGPKHPDVVRLEAAISELTVKIGDALKGLKIGVGHDYETAQAKFRALEEEMEQAKTGERGKEATGYAAFDKAVDELEHAKRIRDALEMRYLEQRIEQNVPRTKVEAIALAKPPDDNDPVSPNLMLYTILSILMGLMTGVGLAYFVEYIDTSLKTVEEVERYMKLPVLAVIPQKVRAFVEKAVDGAHAEAYRMLRTNIQFSEKFKGGKMLCVTSGSVAEGKSITVFNLAFVSAQLGDRVLIVDADLHRPRQHKIVGISNKLGLANYLAGEAALEDTIFPTMNPNLSMLPSGRLNTSIHGLLDSRRMRDLAKIVKERYDLIVFDAPPIIGVSDTSQLVREMDGVLQIIQHRKYPRSMSSRARDMIGNVGGNLLGVVLNNINVLRDYSYYYYYQSHDKTRKPEAAKA